MRVAIVEPRTVADTIRETMALVPKLTERDLYAPTLAKTSTVSQSSARKKVEA